MLAAIRRNLLRREMKASKGRTREQIFSEIYERNIWGGRLENTIPAPDRRVEVNDSYIKTVLSLVAAEGVKSIVDLGCGDF